MVSCMRDNHCFIDINYVSCAKQIWLFGDCASGECAKCQCWVCSLAALCIPRLWPFFYSTKSWRNRNRHAVQRRSELLPDFCIIQSFCSLQMIQLVKISNMYSTIAIHWKPQHQKCPSLHFRFANEKMFPRSASKATPFPVDSKSVYCLASAKWRISVFIQYNNTIWCSNA